MVGILNAAVWCGSAVFVAIGLPALFTEEMKRRLTAPGVGFAAEAVVARFFAVQICCGTIALAHLAAEWLYAGRPGRRLNVALAAGMLAVALAGDCGRNRRCRTCTGRIRRGDRRAAIAGGQGVCSVARGVGNGEFGGDRGADFLPVESERTGGGGAVQQF